MFEKFKKLWDDLLGIHMCIYVIHHTRKKDGTQYVLLRCQSEYTK